MNRRAWAIICHLDQAETGPATMTLSRLVSELRVQIHDALDRRREANIWEHFELQRVMVESERKVLLRGFGLPNRNLRDDSRIVIVLEEVSLQQKRRASQTQAKVQSPDRDSTAP